MTAKQFITPRQLMWIALLAGIVALGQLCPATRVFSDTGASTPMKTFTLQSPAFDNGAWIPTAYTADGRNVSPPLQWSDAPESAKSFAIIMNDPDAPTVQPFIHWVIFNIPASVKNLPEGIPNQGQPNQPAGAVQGNNSFGRMGYGGPAPPPGPSHHYHFTIYALDSTLNLAPGCSADDLRNNMQGHILAQTELLARYGR
jgi:Raf kinase inhibitor-like YbhB/YbcL family protein